MSDQDGDRSIDDAGVSMAPRRLPMRRALWQSLGFLLALAVAWLIFRAYRQPDFLIDFVNMQLC